MNPGDRVIYTNRYLMRGEQVERPVCQVVNEVRGDHCFFVKELRWNLDITHPVPLNAAMLTHHVPVWEHGQ